MKFLRFYRTMRKINMPRGEAFRWALSNLLARRNFAKLEKCREKYSGD